MSEDIYGRNNYKATVVRLPRPDEHPNADKLVIFYIAGTQVIASKDYQGGEIGLFFPDDGQVSEEFAAANDLVRYKDEQGNRKGGMMEHNRRVRAINLRGEKSYGLWLPLSSLSFLNNGEVPDIPEGTELNTYNGHQFCHKFLTAKTIRAIDNREKNKRPPDSSMFPQHVDTINFERNYQDIPPDAIVTITEKIHGTSGRFGLVKREVDYPWYHPARWFGIKKHEWHYMVGSRRVNLGENKEYNPFYGTDAFRYEVMKDVYGKLRKGEVLYFEIVGWVNENTPIMPPVNPDKLADKSFVKKYGKEMYYSYGTKRGERKVYVYRITMANEDGVVIDLSAPQVRQRAKELGLNVPYQYGVVRGGDMQSEYNTAVDNIYNYGRPSESMEDATHFKEGVVVRVDTKELIPTFLKYKNHEFLVLEGHTKDREDYIDLEESS